MLGKKRLVRSTARSEDINPMNYVSNLSDAMLILAVGIMIALVAAWNVDITAVYQESTHPKQDNMVEITDEVEDLHSSSDDDDMTIEDFGLQEYGTIYMDEDGNFYVIEEEP